MLYLKYGHIVALVAALEVSAKLSPFPITSSLSKRGSCDEPCGVVADVDAQCQATSNYEQCVCTADNLMAIDYCFVCIIQELELNEAVNGVLTGGSVTGDITATSVEGLKQQGEATHQKFIDDCAAAGVSLSGGSSSGGSSSSSGSSSGSTGAGSSGSSGGSSSGGSTSGGSSSGGSSSGGSGSGGSSSGSSGSGSSKASGGAGSSTTSTPTLENPKNAAGSGAKAGGLLLIAGVSALVAML
ncbi:hypothetical protein NMY22_g3644 [Coprinellus aureogranulatus]|nr:hypothetical protein NMY22_g3644 [Coprinellus aureogranulatus]